MTKSTRFRLPPQAERTPRPISEVWAEIRRLITLKDNTEEQGEEATPYQSSHNLFVTGALHALVWAYGRLWQAPSAHARRGLQLRLRPGYNLEYRQFTDRGKWWYEKKGYRPIKLERPARRATEPPPEEPAYQAETENPI